MAIGGNGMGYSKLEVPKDGLSQSLQFWGAQAGQRKAAADLANERTKVRAEEAAAKKEADRVLDVKSKEAKWEPTWTGYGTNDDIQTGLANQFTDIYSKALGDYDAATKSGDKEAMRVASTKMEGYKRETSRYSATAKTLKEANDKAFKLNQEGKASSFYSDELNDLQTIAGGSAENVSAQWDDQGRIRPIIKSVDENGVETIKAINVEDYVGGALSNIQKFDTDAAVDTLTKEMGSFKKTYYSKNRDVTEEGYNPVAENQLRAVIKNKVSDSDVKAWAGENLGAKLADLKKDPKLLAEWRKGAEEELFKRVMGAEKRVDGSAYNNIEQKNALEAQRIAAMNKPKPKELKPEDIRYGSRKSDIENLTSDNPDPTIFNTRVIQAYNGRSNLTVVNSKIVNGKLILEVTDKKGERVSPVVIDKSNPRAINDLFNATEDPKKGIDFDRVIQVDPYKYREYSGSTPTTFREHAKESFDSQGNFKGTDDQLVNYIKEIYPEANAKNIYLGKGNIEVNGKRFYTNNIDAILKEVEKGGGATQAATQGQVR